MKKKKRTKNKKARVLGEAVLVVGNKSLLNCISKLLNQQGGQQHGLTSNNSSAVCRRTIRCETHAKKERSENESNLQIETFPI